MDTMTLRKRLTIIAAVLVSGCETARPPEPAPERDPPGPALRLLNVEFRLAAMEAGLGVTDISGRADRLESIAFLRRHLARTVDAVQKPDAAQWAKVRVDLLEVGEDLIRIDAEGTLARISAMGRHACNEGLQDVFTALRQTEGNPAAALSADVRALLGDAEQQRREARRWVMVGLVSRAGVDAASTVSAAYSLSRLATSGAPRRLTSFLRPGEMAVLEAAGTGGRVTVRVLAAHGVLALTDAEIYALAQAGVLSAAAIQLLAMNKAATYDAGAFGQWVSAAQTGPPRGGNPAAADYQVKHCGPREYRLPPGAGEEGIWADGIRQADGTILEAKYVGQPGKSPYVPNSQCPDHVCAKVLRETLDEFRRYAQLLRTPGVPARALEVITNDAGAADFFRRLMRELGIAGQVVVRP